MYFWNFIWGSRVVCIIDVIIEMSLVLLSGAGYIDKVIVVCKMSLWQQTRQEIWCRGDFCEYSDKTEGVREKDESHYINIATISY